MNTVAADLAPDTVKSLRARTGRTQADIADAAPLSLPVVGKIERGDRSVHLASVYLYAAEIGAEPYVVVAAMDVTWLLRRVAALRKRRPAQTCRAPRVGPRNGGA